MAGVAVICLSPILQVFFKRMASGEFVDFFEGQKLCDKLLKELKIQLMSVNAVLEDAEEQRFTRPDVKEWLDKLEDVMCDAEEICDEIATKDLRQKLDAEFGTFGSKVRNLISTYRFVKNVERKINYAVHILECLARQLGCLGLRKGVGRRNLSERQPTTYLVDESNIVGRHAEREAIINSLLSDDDKNIGVIAIVGMGGIGKTFLAQLVYNEDSVKKHFDLKAWVCVSDDFDVLKLTKIILEEVSSSANADSKNLNQLQIKLKEALIGKKFLLVLDDVLEKSYDKWEELSKALKYGAPGSKVIVTTRDDEVASFMSTSATHSVTELPEKDCWSLFAKYAFHDGNSNAYPDLEAIGRQIVEKCKGLPLAIKVIGALLQSKLDVEEWDKILRSELWDLPIGETGILPGLRLSYKYLSPHLKRCFAYCSIFPRDYAFKKDKLILLWMAEGFLLQTRNKTMEEVGDNYFFALVSRSLFQKSNHNSYIMPNLVYDLTKSISTRFTLSHEDDCSPEITSNTLHFSYFCSKFDFQKFATFHGVKRLRTILQLNSDVQFASYSDVSQLSIPMLRSLHVLSLSYYQKIAELPNSIGKLIHLRYLDLSYTGIKRLPDSICKLCNLQTLNLSNCWYLAAFPRDLYKLINLRHLDFAQAKMIMEMPINMGELRCLQTLTKFIVGKHGRSGIGELGKLTNLRGSLIILELQNVESPTYMILREKHLTELVMEWRFDANDPESQILVLSCLQPHTSLKILAINGYGGKSFPNWVGHTSFSNITSLRLEHCTQCCNLPPLGQLPSLQDLSIVGFVEVVKVGQEFYGSGSSSIKPFEALKVLKFKCMLKWEEWFSFDAENEAELNIRDADNLMH
ncbi:putative disease resistance RPP13-like protein 1 isoform X2 [Corylus avellana]|uniref:putative disease resistance RPP13-like protein 1 isoform X2 n=1 Tax=Corylus avellana TaxID=13451 RepID=UPI00286C7FA1|nr:putative disease resistance RPP13-like protein 1 isoform X2 [Corylus avellana]